MGVNIWINRKQIYLDVYVHGQRQREKLQGLILIGDKATDKETMRLAEIAKAKRAQQVFSGEWSLIDPVAGKQTLYEYIKKFSAKRGPKDRVKRVLYYLKQYHGGLTITLAQINEAWVEDFQNFLKGTKLAPSSAASYSAGLRIAFNQAVKDKILIRSPAQNVKGIGWPEVHKVFLNPDEIQKLAGITLGGRLGPDIKKAFLFACYTGGLRISDLKTIKWGAVEYSPLQIIKRQEKTQDHIYIPLSKMAWSIINDGTIHNYEEYIFPELAATKGLHHARFITWAKKAGINKKIGWHTARHTFAVQSLEAGVDIYTVSKLLGHKNLKTTQVYAKATDKMKRTAVEALPAITL